MKKQFSFPRKTFRTEIDGKKVHIHYIEIKGKKKGPKIFVSSGMHGNEVGGIATNNALITYLDNYKDLRDNLSGSLIIIPVLNPGGFKNMERYIPEDGQDPNRSYGYIDPKLFSQKLCNAIGEFFFKDCDAGIDLHSGGGMMLMPHVRIHKKQDCERTNELGRVFGTRIIIERKGDKHMMSVAIKNKYDIPVITAEIGGSQMVHPEFIQEGLRGLLNIMKYLDMIPGEIQLPEKQYSLKARSGVKTHYAGEIHFNKKIGDFVHAGEEIGTIYFPQLQKMENLLSPVCGFVFAKWQRHQIPKNTVMYGIIESKKCHERLEKVGDFIELPEFSLKKFNFSK